MEQTKSAYAPLFSIEIWHDFFLRFKGKKPTELVNELPDNYDIRHYLTIRPTDQSQKTLQNFGLKWLSGAKGGTLYANSEMLAAGEYKTYPRLTSQISLTFEVFVTNNQFLLFTNLPLFTTANSILYFNNLSGQKTGDGSYLSQPMKELSASDGGKNISAGEIVTNADNDGVYESIAGVSTSGKLNDPKKWLPFRHVDSASAGNHLRGIQVVTEKDLLPKVVGSYYYERANDAPGSELKFKLKDVHDQEIPLGDIPGTNIPQNSTRTPTVSTIPITHRLQLQHLPKGKYNLTVDGDVVPRVFYLFNTATVTSPIGVIEIFGGASDPAFQLFQEKTIDGKLESVFNYKPADNKKPEVKKVFKIRFKNRSTWWRYFPEGDVTKPPKRTLINPLSSHYIAVTGELPNPSNALTVEKNSTTGEVEAFYSDIYLYDRKI